MNAILLAAGFGTRLMPLTSNTPKCLMPINNKPLLQIWLEILSKSKIEKFLINTHYLYEDVDNFIKNSCYKNKCTVVYEKKLLGTAGTLINNISFTENKDCMLIHADNYCLANITEFINAHNNRPSNCLMTMMIFETTTPESCGIVKLDSMNRVIEFHEKKINVTSNLANGAVYILSRELINLLNTKYKKNTDFSTDIIPKLIGKIYAYKTDETFIDIGTPETYKSANSLPKSNID
jgi:mannose-1-phosphate guanylyltransferase